MRMIIITLAFLTLFACQPDKKPIHVNNSETRGSQMAYFKGKPIELPKNNIYELVNIPTGDEDLDFTQSIYKNLVLAEKETSLAVSVLFSQDTIQDGIMVFSLECEQHRELSMEIFDEEGFQYAGKNTLYAHRGNNYYGLNLTSLDDGNYIFRLSDNQDGDYARQIVVKHED